MKKYNFFLIIILIVLVVCVRLWMMSDDRDYTLGLVGNDGVSIVSISFDRKMVNSLVVKDEIRLWIPGGLDWYEANKIKRLLEQESRPDLAKEILYYNLGFLADKIIFLDDFKWNKMSVLIPNLGLWGWIKFYYWQDQMLFKEETLASGLLLERELALDEIMVRDFGDSKLLNQDLRLTVFNTTECEGLAGFVASRLSWAGFSVMGIGSAKEETNNCMLTYGLQSNQGYGWKVLTDIFDCKQMKDEALTDYEVEIYLGEGFCQMINYNGYVGAF